jgi:hypothetical protein
MIQDAPTLATPSQLQTQYRRLLTLAEDGQVWIQQRGGKPTITLMNLSSWEDATRARAWLSILSAVVKYAVGRVVGEQFPVCPSEFSWLSHYDTDDVRTFVSEFSGAIVNVMSTTGTWDDVDAVVEEWCRSAALLVNQEIRDRFRQASEEMKN